MPHYFIHQNTVVFEQFFPGGSFLVPIAGPFKFSGDAVAALDGIWGRG